jgi:hypothetical protein
MEIHRRGQKRAKLLGGKKIEDFSVGKQKVVRKSDFPELSERGISEYSKVVITKHYNVFLTLSFYNSFLIKEP